MPDDEKILGFSNRWYAMGIKTAERHMLTPELEIRRLAPPLFLATKLEAYRGRGGNDPLTSHDLEDVLIVIDGREEILTDVAAADEDVRGFIASEIRALRKHNQFDSFIGGNIRGPEGRVDIIHERLDALAAGDGAV